MKKSKPGTGRSTGGPRRAAARSRKVIVDFPAALYARTEAASVELAMNRSALIRYAVEQYLDAKRKEKLERELAEGYIANAGLARKTAEEFAHVDAELT